MRVERRALRRLLWEPGRNTAEGGAGARPASGRHASHQLSLHPACAHHPPATRQPLMLFNPAKLPAVSRYMLSRGLAIVVVRCC